MRSRLDVVTVASVAWIAALIPNLPAVEPHWLWNDPEATVKAAAGDVAFRKTFEIAESGEAAIEVAADNSYEVFLNGRRVGTGDGWNPRRRFPVTAILTPGRNVLAIRGVNAGDVPNPAAMMARLTIKPKGKDPIEIVSDASWKALGKPAGGWHRIEFDDSKWSAAVSLGDYGKAGPWGGPGNVDEQAPAVATKPRSQERGALTLKDGDRVVLLGGTFFEREQNFGYFQAAIVAGYPGKNIAVRNLGWSGDNVYGESRAVFGSRADGFKRLIADVQLCEPTVVVVHYGEVEAHEGDRGVASFRDGLETLLDGLEATGARLVLLAPRQREAGPAKSQAAERQYNAALQQIAETLKETADRRGHLFHDLADWAAGERLTENGVHLAAYGYRRLAPRFARMLGAESGDSRIDVDLSGRSIDATGAEITQLNSSDEGATFFYRQRVAPLADLERASWDIVSTTERAPASTPPRWNAADAKPTTSATTVRVRGLRPGTYELVVDEKVVAKANAYDFGKPEGVKMHPLADQAEELRQTLVAKDFLFFNRYRPQNETYLFLFRKHEQGNNAVEIPQFDPLIAEMEKRIAELRQTRPQKCELRRVGD